MLAYAIRRVLLSIPVLFAASFVVFVLATFAGDPLSEMRTRRPPVPPESIRLEEQRLNLDEPLLERYWNWLVGVLPPDVDFGPSVLATRDIGGEIGDRLFITLRLIAAAMVIAVVLAVVVGVVSAVRQYSRLDYTLTFAGFLFLSLPTFWFANLLKLYGIQLNDFFGTQIFFTIGERSVYLPPGVWNKVLDALGHLILPTIALGLTQFAAWSRFQRASMLEVMNSDYVRLARAKGLSRRRVMTKHALRTALIPLTTVTALDLGALIGGAVVTETVFQWRGMGEFLVDSLGRRDIYAIEAWLLLAGAFVILFNLIADLLYGVLDPRIRYE